MSDTTTDGTRTLHAAPAPAPEPLTELTGAPSAIYTELLGLTEGATVAELALAAGVGRSTAGKAVTTLEQHGLAVRTPGGHDGPRRTPDRWHPAPTHDTSSGDGSSDQEPASTQPDPSITDSPEPVGNSTDHEGAPTAETTPEAPDAPDDGSTNAVTVPTTEEPQDTPPQNTEHGEGDDGGEGGPHDEDDSDGSGDEDAPAPQAGAGRPTRQAEAIILPGEKKRLAPGALRQMVIDHLEAHPGEAFTATKISRVIEKSSGAIANALVTLAQQGIAEQVDDRPRTYRLAAPEGNE
jgi:biotin operon repressor